MSRGILLSGKRRVTGTQAVNDGENGAMTETESSEAPGKVRRAQSPALTGQVKSLLTLEHHLL